jgi:hypothetical protein
MGGLVARSAFNNWLLPTRELRKKVARDMVEVLDAVQTQAREVGLMAAAQAVKAQRPAAFENFRRFVMLQSESNDGLRWPLWEFSGLIPKWRAEC